MATVWGVSTPGVRKVWPEEHLQDHRPLFVLIADLRVASEPKDAESLPIAGEELFCGPPGERQRLGAERSLNDRRKHGDINVHETLDWTQHH